MVFAEPKVYQPLNIEVIPAGSDVPVLVKQPGSPEFKPVSGGLAVKSNPGSSAIDILPPIQSDKQLKSAVPNAVPNWKPGTGSSGKFVNQGYKNFPVQNNYGGSGSLGGEAIADALTPMISGFVTGVYDEIMNQSFEPGWMDNPMYGLDYQMGVYYDIGVEVTDNVQQTIEDLNMEENIDNAWNDFQDNLDNIPQWGLPELNLPQINLPEVPQINLPDLPELDLPQIDLPQIELPNFPNISLPQLNWPNFPELDFPPINLPTFGFNPGEQQNNWQQPKPKPEPKTEDKVKEIINIIPEGCYATFYFCRYAHRKYHTQSAYNYWVRWDFEQGSWIKGEPPVAIVGGYEDLFGNVAPYFDLPYDPIGYSSIGQQSFEVGIYDNYRINQDTGDAILWSFAVQTAIGNNSHPNQFFKLIYPGYDPNSSDRVINIGDYKLYAVTFVCDLPSDNPPIININPPPQPDPPIPPKPPEVPPMNCCSCQDIASILQLTFQSMKYQITIPSVVCELNVVTSKWEPKVSYNTFSVFAVDAATATAQAELYRQLAIQAKEICESKNIGQVLGVDEYPATLPKSLITKNETFAEQALDLITGDDDTVQITNLTSLISWTIERLDELFGQWEIPIEIKDSDPLTPGDQPKGIRLPNLAEYAAESFLMQYSMLTNMEALISMCTRTMFEVGQNKQQDYVTYQSVQAIIDYLGFKIEEKKIQIPMMFTPGKEELDQLLKESQVNVIYPEFGEKVGLVSDLHRMRKACGIIEALGWRKVNVDGDVLGQVMSGIRAAKDILSEMQGNEEDEWDDFKENVEKGYSDQPMHPTPNKPYGKPYDERPRIKEFGNPEQK